MSEEQKESGGGTSLKNIILGLVSTITLGVGGWFTTKLTGGDDKDAAPTQQVAPIVINNNNSQQQAAGGTKTVIVKEKAAAPAPAKPKKDGDEFKEKPAQW